MTATQPSRVSCAPATPSLLHCDIPRPRTQPLTANISKFWEAPARDFAHTHATSSPSIMAEHDFPVALRARDLLSRQRHSITSYVHRVAECSLSMLPVIDTDNMRAFKALRRSIKGEKDGGKPQISIAPKSAVAIVPPKKARHRSATAATHRLTLSFFCY
jgi:hypothetical protein